MVVSVPRRVAGQPVAIAGTGVLLAAAWLIAWGFVVVHHPQPLGVDNEVAALLTTSKHWQDAGLTLLRVEGPVGVALGTAAVAMVTLLCRAPRTAGGILVGVAAEIASVQ